MYVAYLRVSTSDQNLARQEQSILDWQKKNDIDDAELKVFKEKMSGKNITDRTELNNMLSFIRERDTVVITSLDGLEEIVETSRNYYKRWQIKEQISRY